MGLKQGESWPAMITATTGQPLDEKDPRDPFSDPPRRIEQPEPDEETVYEEAAEEVQTEEEEPNSPSEEDAHGGKTSTTETR